MKEDENNVVFLAHLRLYITEEFTKVSMRIFPFAFFYFLVKSLADNFVSTFWFVSVTRAHWVFSFAQNAITIKWAYSLYKNELNWYDPKLSYAICSNAKQRSLQVAVCIEKTFFDSKLQCTCNIATDTDVIRAIINIDDIMTSQTGKQT